MDNQKNCQNLTALCFSVVISTDVPVQMTEFIQLGNKLEICPPGEPAGDEDGDDYKPPDERVPGKGGWIPTDCETTGNFSSVQKLQLPDSHPYCNCLITKCKPKCKPKCIYHGPIDRTKVTMDEYWYCEVIFETLIL